MTVALNRQRKALAKVEGRFSAEHCAGGKAPFDGRSRCATAAQGYGLFWLDKSASPATNPP